MPSLDLPALVRAQGKRRRPIVLRPVIPTASQASDLAAIILRVMAIWAEAKPRILAGYDPRPIADALTRDDTAAMQRAIDTAAGEVSRVIVSIGASLAQWAVRAEKWHRDRFTANVRAATTIDLSTVLSAQPVSETLEAWLARNTALVRNISDQAQQRISDAVFRGYQQRLPVREVAKEIDRAVGLGRNRARLVASDQLSKLSGALDVERMAEVGIELWKYRHSGKSHPRSWHRARDGRIYTLMGGKQVHPDGTAMAGGDVIEAGDGPSEPPWCGCRRQSYLPILAELK